MPRIFKPKGTSYWWTDTRDLPGGRRQTTKTKDETVAKTILGDRIRENDDGKHTGVMSYRAARDIYLEHRKQKNYKTFQADKLGLTEFEDICALSAITRTYPEHLQRFANYLKHDRVAKFKATGQAQANKLFRAVLMFLNYCEDENWIKPQRWKKVEKPFPDTKPRKFRYTPKETEDLLKAYGLNWIGTTLRLGYYCGLRRSEVFHLTWADVDFKREQILLTVKPHWKVKGYKDSDPPSVVPAPAPLLFHLRKVLKTRRNAQPHDKVIVGCPSLQTMTKRITAAIRELYPKGTLHTMRHTIIGHLLDAGEAPAHVQKYARHKKIQQTMDYADVREEVARTVHKSIPVKEK